MVNNSQTIYEFQAAPEDLIWAAYKRVVADDPEIKNECISAAKEMKELPYDELDARQDQIGAAQKGADKLVERRTAPNPFVMIKEAGAPKALDDPALRNNPLRGRLMITIATTFLLFFVFLQTLMYSYVVEGVTIVPENSNFGPSGAVLQALGALDTNLIRAGQTSRLFWSCFMHSGWLHIGMNLISQLQYFLMFEPDWGFFRCLFIFYGSMVIGNIFSAILDPCIVAVGSSGGLFGLMACTVPYCMEYWKTIPRPMSIVIMTIIVVIATLAMGFNSSGTDNWAHMGGFLGGMSLGFTTIANLNVCFKNKQTNKVTKMKIKKFSIFRRFQNSCNPNCKCGVREWIVRLVSFSVYCTLLGVGLNYLLHDTEFQPFGGVTYHGRTHCCCCIPAVKPTGLLPPDMDDIDTYSDVFCSPCRNSGGYAMGYKYGVLDPEAPTNIQSVWPCSWVKEPIDWEKNWDPFDPSTQVAITDESNDKIEPEGLSIIEAVDTFKGEQLLNTNSDYYAMETINTGTILQQEEYSSTQQTKMHSGRKSATHHAHGHARKTYNATALTATEEPDYSNLVSALERLRSG